MPLITNSTQEHLDIEDIKDDLVILKNATAAAVLQTTAVNFDLLSEIEQDAMISAFAMLLNSLSFPVQIFIRSKKLDITKYLEKLHRNESKITDTLLKSQAQAYRKFVQEVIEKNEVLDKKFYVIVSTQGNKPLSRGKSPFDWLTVLLGTHNKRVQVNVEEIVQKAKIELAPRLDHVATEFNRLGVKTKRLDTQELVELYFDLYNPTTIHGQRIRTNIADYKTAVVNPAMIEE